MGRFLKGVSLKPVQANLEAGGTPIPLAASSETLLSWNLKSPFRYPLVLKQTSPEKTWLSLTVRGYRTRGYKPVRDQGLQIFRRLLTRNGKPVSTLSPGDLLLMEVKLINRSSGTMRHCAIRLPMVAGIEVVNSKPFTRRPPAWAGKKKHLLKPVYLNVRDRQTTLFGALPPGDTLYYLLVRATFSYKGVMPPPEAELMYQPWIHTTGDSITVEVK
jgi:uncharacterized protein YfaS (alpha-2-macroglobulin family)